MFLITHEQQRIFNLRKSQFINDAAAQKKGEAASSIEYRIGVQKPTPKQLNNSGRQKFFFPT